MSNVPICPMLTRAMSITGNRPNTALLSKTLPGFRSLPRRKKLKLFMIEVKNTIDRYIKKNTSNGPIGAVSFGLKFKI